MKKVTQDQIDSLLDNSQAEEHIFHGGKCMVVSYQLPCGFTVEGRAGLVDVSQFNIQTGRSFCRKDAVKKLFQLEGYMLQHKLAAEDNPDKAKTAYWVITDIKLNKVVKRIYTSKEDAVHWCKLNQMSNLPDGSWDADFTLEEIAGESSFPYNPIVEKVLLLAQEIAISSNEKHLGSDHILTSLMSVSNTNAFGVLRSLLLLKPFSKRLENIKLNTAQDISLLLTEEAERVLKLASDKAIQLGLTHYSTEHILFAIASDPDCLGGRVLFGLNIDLTLLRKRIVEDVFLNY